jgi:hypothetical protein
LIACTLSWVTNLFISTPGAGRSRSSALEKPVLTGRSSDIGSGRARSFSRAPWHQGGVLVPDELVVHKVLRKWPLKRFHPA